MKLMTKAILKTIPEMYSTEKIPLEEKVIKAKIFGGAFTWYIVEKEEVDDDVIFFGYVYNAAEPQFSEWGDFSLNQLSSVKIKPFNLPLERDLYFKPKKFKDIKLAIGN